MRPEINWVMCLAAVAASLAMSVEPGRAANADVKECERISQADAQIGCYTNIIEDESAAPAIRAGAYGGRSAVLANKGEYDLAIADATEAIAINAKYERAYFVRGLAYHQKGEVDLAIVDYTRAIDIAPRNADALINRANLYDRKGERDRAIKEFDAILAMNSAKPLLSEMGRSLTYLNRGVARFNRGELDPAIADFDKAIEIDPKLAYAYHNRGRAYRSKGEFDRAIAEFKKAVELGSKITVAQSELLRTYLAAGKAAMARLQNWVTGDEKRVELTD